MEENIIDINGEKIVFYVQRKNVKNLILRINKENKIVISIPRRMPIENAKKFIKEKISWIKKKQKLQEEYIEKRENIKFKNGEKIYLLGKKYVLKIIKDFENNVVFNGDRIELHVKYNYIENTEYIKNVYEKFLKEYAQIIFEEYVRKYCKMLEKYNIIIPEIKIRKMKAKWGCCMPSKQKIILNLHLIKTPIECIEYVILHELSHFKYQNHKKDFYNFIEQFMPNWKLYREILNKEFTHII